MHQTLRSSLIVALIVAVWAAIPLAVLSGAGCGVMWKTVRSTDRCMTVRAHTDREAAIALEAAEWVAARVPGSCGFVEVIRTDLPMDRAGQTASPVRILMHPVGYPIPSLTHECVHAALWRATGDPDRNHVHAQLFGDANVRDAQYVHGVWP